VADELKITAGPFTFVGRLETKVAPMTCAAFVRSLPFRSRLVHVRWSGEAVWIPLGNHNFGVGYENHTSYPAPGQIILYPGGISETEIPSCLWQRPFRQQDGTACRQPFPDDHLRSREPRGVGPYGALERGTGHHLRGEKRYGPALATNLSCVASWQIPSCVQRVYDVRALELAPGLSDA
jgi:uncharacterized protein DUF3830